MLLTVHTLLLMYFFFFFQFSSLLYVLGFNPKRALLSEGKDILCSFVFVTFCSAYFLCLEYLSFCIYRNSTHSLRPNPDDTCSLNPFLTHPRKGIHSLPLDSLVVYCASFYFLNESFCINIIY